MTSATPKPRAGEHTKGPWRYSVNVGPTKGLLVEEDGSTILELANSTRSSRFERDIQRIVACVNACERIPTASLELGDTKHWIKEEIAMRAERDALAAQLETCKAAHMSNCLDADKLRTRIAELREVLEHVCDTISGPAPALRRAREILAKHGR